MRDIYQIVKQEIWANMDRTIHVSSFDITNDIITLNVCDTKWARVGLGLVDDAPSGFTIVTVDHENRVITLNGSSWVGNGTLQRYKFFIGTPISTNEEWTAFSRDERQKVPFVWMVEPTQEEIQGVNSDLERISDIRLVFLDDNFIGKWLTDEVHENRLQAIYNAVEWFLKAIKGNPLFEFKDTYVVKNFTKFGTESTQGFAANIIDANLTGIEVRLSLPINKDDNCNC